MDRSKRVEVSEIEALGSDDLKTFGGVFEGGIYLQQIPDEIAPCINDIIESGRPMRNMLEIGSAAGGNVWLFDSIFGPENVAIIDDNKHPRADRRPGMIYGVDAKVHEYIGNSHTASALRFIKSLDMEFDAIFIDGDHGYSGARCDFEMFSPFLAEGGFIILHDTAAFAGIAKLAQEVEAAGFKRVGEYVSKTHPKPCGIGTFQKNGAAVYVAKSRRVSIIIPVIRKERAKLCMAAIHENAGVPRDQYEIVTAFDQDAVGCPEMVKSLVGMTNFDLVMFLGDDTVPQPGFLRVAIDTMEMLPDGWGVVGLNTEPGNPVAHWMADKRMVEHIPGGQFFSTDYRHCWCDNELKDIAADLGRWAFAKDAVVEHDHPVNKRGEWDEGLQRAYAEEARAHDFKTYLKRKRGRNVALYGVRLAVAVPLTDDRSANQFWFSFMRIWTHYLNSLHRKKSAVGLDFITPNYPGQIDAVRNDLVRQAIHSGCTHILMLDTDQIYQDEDMIEKMLSHGLPVVGARVHRRYPPFDPLLLRGEVNNLESVPDDEIDAGGLVEVDATGCGCILYDTRIFIDSIVEDKEQWFELAVGERGQTIGEDIGFCSKLKSRGVDIFVDCDIDIRHLTLMAVDMGTHKLFKKIYAAEVRKNGARI